MIYNFKSNESLSPIGERLEARSKLTKRQCDVMKYVMEIGNILKLQYLELAGGRHGKRAR